MTYEYVVELEVIGKPGITRYITKAKSPSQAMMNAVDVYPRAKVVRVY